MKLWQELNRRKVVQTGIAYLVFSWIVAQVAGLLLESFEAPVWAMQWLRIGLAIGFPLALIVSWLYKFKPPQLLEEDQKIASSQHAPSITVIPFQIIIICTLGSSYFKKVYTGNHSMSCYEVINRSGISI